MKELKLRQMVREEIRKQFLKESAINDLLKQIEDMAFNGEIGSGQEGIMTRDELAKEVIKAVRRGRSKFDKSQPDYADRMAARKEKSAATKAASAERAKEFEKEFKVRSAAERAEREERIANNQLPLKLYTDFTDIKSNLGKLLAYYNDYGDLITLKDQFKDKSFAPEVAQAVWNGKKWTGFPTR